ncbi:MAG: MBL fold metallo-hydrolase [Tannerella sp.]|jgi:alkyl sulfatase BDS1-like metallo-beta-lactamase superfamily hydrolase|nr:MBL fold metallo-hydrolase [Tannerella sp.]
MKKSIILSAATLLLFSCNSNQEQTTVSSNSPDSTMPKEATAATTKCNHDVLSLLDFSDKQAFEDAQRGFIATLPDMDIKDVKGRVIWSLKDYAFLEKEEAPATVNPSLWRQARLNMFNGLFKVTDNIYQIRGFDLSNMTIIEGKTGLIIIDPLVSPETAKAGLELYYEKIGKKPVNAVIYTHSHIDHYGGVHGVIDEADAKSGKVKVVAPQGFFEAAISENVYAGTAMGRRALYHTGAILPKGEKGQVDDGLGKTASTGESGIIEPNVIINQTGQKLNIDGVDMVFLMAHGTEAPSEMLFYFPQFKALCAAEDCTHNLHNLYTLRGAQVRDAKAWWQTLNSVVEMFGTDVQVMFAQHHWPTWDNNRVVEMLESQRDMYKYLHDHTLNLINKGYTMLEVGEMVKLPESLDKKFYNRGYYGSVNHDAKAVYQKYIGFYSGNPSDLHQLVPEDAAKKYVEYMGGADAIMSKAQKDYDKGEYRWVAQIMNQVVFADPNNVKAKNLLADALEQLGYQAESGTWRNNYLQGVSELRNGVPEIPFHGVASPSTVKSMTLDMIFDYMGIRLNAEKANGKKLTFNFEVQDTKDKYAVELENSVLIYTKDKTYQNPDATITLSTKAPFNEVIAGYAKLDEQVKSGQIKISGNQSKVEELMGMMDNFKYMFNIMTP